MLMTCFERERLASERQQHLLQEATDAVRATRLAHSQRRLWRERVAIGLIELALRLAPAAEELRRNGRSVSAFGTNRAAGA